MRNLIIVSAVLAPLMVMLMSDDLTVGSLGLLYAVILLIVSRRTRRGRKIVRDAYKEILIIEGSL